MKTKLLPLILLPLIGCSDGNDATVVGNPPTSFENLGGPNGLALSDASAVGLAKGSGGAASLALSQAAANESTASATNSALIGIKDSGETFVIDSKRFDVKALKGVSEGFLMEAALKEPSASSSYGQNIYFVRLDGKVFPLSDLNWGVPDVRVYSLSDFSGQNSKRDLIFRSGNVFRFATGKSEMLSSNLKGFYVDRMSGNFAIVSATEGNVRQLYDTVSEKRFNLTQSSYEIAALSPTRVLVGDYSDTPLLDVQSEARLKSEIKYDVSQQVPFDGGAILLSTYCPRPAAVNSYPNKTFLCEVNPDGVGKILLSDAVEERARLMGSKDYLVYQETKNIYWVKRGTDHKNPILENLNVLEVKAAGEFVFYRAETTSGALIAGVYDMPNAKNIELKDWSSKLSKIELIGK